LSDLLPTHLPPEVVKRVSANFAEPARASWTQTWLAVAEAMSQRSGCIRRQAGCVIVSADNRVVATGYNGPPATMCVPRTATAFWVTGAGVQTANKTQYTDATCAKDCPRSQPGAESGTNNYDNCISLHSEENALLYAERRDVEGGSLYQWGGLPCWHCAKLIAGSGIKHVYAWIGERDKDRAQQVERLWAWCGVEFHRQRDLECPED
jgi:dCMP deaminase